MSYEQAATVYDLIYEWKDYARESNLLRWIIAANKRCDGNTLLDVACGTGKHMAELQRDFAVEGLDVSESLLAMARQRLPDVAFHHADMTSFDLGRRYDVITCLFSAIGHVKTPDKLRDALSRMSMHVNLGGLVIVEPWFAPDQYHAGSIHKLFVDKPDIKIARMSVSEVQGNMSIMDLHHLVADASGVRHFVERLEMGLFTQQEYLDAFARARLDATFDGYGLMGRGLYIGAKTGAKA